MANKKISQLTNSLTKATIATNDIVPVVDTSASETKKMTYQELIQPTDANFRIAGSADNTKLLAFEVDGFTTATTRTVTVPDANTTMVGTDTTQTLTNKTLTSPVLNLTSDATGDMYYRNSSGALTRLPIGTALQVLNVDGTGIPAWVANPSASSATYAVAGISTLDADVRYYAADAGSNDTYVITLSPAPSAYTTGMKISFKANTVNTGAATLNVNSLGAKTIVKGVNTTLADGDIAAGQFCTVIYDGTNFVLQNPTNNVVTRGASDFSLVSSNTFSQSVATATYTTIAQFTGLDGDTDDTYKIIFNVNFSTLSNSSQLCLTFNNDTGSNYSYSLMFNGSGAFTTPSGSGGSAGNNIVIANYNTNYNINDGVGEILIKGTKTTGGQYRLSCSDYVANTNNFRGSGYYSSTSTNITSIELNAYQSSGLTATVSGKASIYKINRS